MKKHPLKSLTIWSQLVIVGCVIALFAGPTPLQPDFTTAELCDWALATSQGQKSLFVMMIIVCSSIIGIGGRLRVKEHEDENE